MDKDQPDIGVLSESKIGSPESTRKDNSTFSVEEENFQVEDSKVTLMLLDFDHEDIIFLVHTSSKFSRVLFCKI